MYISCNKRNFVVSRIFTLGPVKILRQGEPFTILFAYKDNNDMFLANPALLYNFFDDPSLCNQIIFNSPKIRLTVTTLDIDKLEKNNIRYYESKIYYPNGCTTYSEKLFNPDNKNRKTHYYNPNYFISEAMDVAEYHSYEVCYKSNTIVNLMVEKIKTSKKFFKQVELLSKMLLDNPDLVSLSNWEDTGFKENEGLLKVPSGITKTIN